MKAQSLPAFIEPTRMVFLKNLTEDEYFELLQMKEQGIIENIEALGNGKVIWFYDSKETLLFLLRHGQ